MENLVRRPGDPTVESDRWPQRAANDDVGQPYRCTKFSVRARLAVIAGLALALWAAILLALVEVSPEPAPADSPALLAGSRDRPAAP